MRVIFGTFSSLAALSEERPGLRHLARVRWGLLLAALVLAAIGLVTIHSASAELAGEPLPRQVLWVGLGLVAFLIAFSFDYELLSKFALPIYLVSLTLLALVLVFGHEAGGARSWLGFGGYRLQPSEFAKIATVILLARYLAGLNRPCLRLSEILVAGGVCVVPMALVGLNPDLGGAAMFLPMLGGMLLMAGLRWKLVLVGVVVVLLLAAALWGFVMLDYQKDRVKSFLSPGSDPLGSGYQIRQSKIAVGSGQLFGRGYLQGTQSQLRFLPARHTDFIFAVLAEEWGFVGVAAVLTLYAVYVLNGARVGMRARDRTGILLVVGLLSGFAFHVLYNTAMVVGLVPITGIPLPFLSYGGSFTVANFSAAGLILGVDFRRHVNR
ncbi:MAG: rod shape-determining protein RodA [Thermoanaerobaculia bacterium]